MIGAVAIAGGAFALVDYLREDSTEISAPDPAVTVDDTPTTTERGVGVFNAPSTTAPSTTTSSTTSAPTTTSTTTPPEPGVCDPQNTRSARLSGGQLFLEGEVPSAKVGEAIQAKAAAVIGAENVFNNYQIVPGAPLPDCAPVIVEDTVLFAFGSAELTGQYEPLLNLAVGLLAQNPEAQITVVAHTDAIDSRAFNQRLSDARAQAIYDYWISAGVDPDRVDAVGKGEDEPIADNNTAAGRRQNRRAEFQVRNLL